MLFTAKYNFFNWKNIIKIAKKSKNNINKNRVNTENIRSYVKLRIFILLLNIFKCLQKKIKTMIW